MSVNESNFVEQSKNFLKFKSNQKSKLERNIKVIEGLNNLNFEEPLDKEISNSMNELSTMETKFKQTLSNYSTSYKNYMDELLRYTQENKSKYEPKQFVSLVDNFNKMAKTELIQQNNDLIQQSQQIYSKIQNVNRDLNNVNHIKNVNKEELQKQLNTFNGILNDYKTFNYNTDTYSQMMSDNIMITNSSYYKYIL